MNEKTKAWILLLVLSVVWGSSYILIKLALSDASGVARLTPMQLGAVRMTIASGVLLPFFFKLRKTIPKNKILFVAISGFVGNGLPSFLFAFAQTRLDSSITGMLNSIVPIFAILIATFIFGFTMKWNHIVGMSIGILGAYIIMYSKLAGVVLTQSDLVPFGLIIVATVCYATSLNVIKYKLSGLNPMAITSMAFIFAGAPSLVYLLATNFPKAVITNSNVLEGVGFVFILAVVGTAIAVYLFNHLIKLSTPIFASSVTYFIPVVATLLGVVSGESVTYYQILGMGVLISGVLLINRK